MRIDERSIVNKSKREDSDTQPFAADVPQPRHEPDFSSWQGPVTSMPDLWIPGSAVPKVAFVLNVCSGVRRDGDFKHQVEKLSGGAMSVINIDLKVGGYAHALDDPKVAEMVKALCDLPHCVGGLFQPPCNTVSALRFDQPGPPVLRDLNEPDGKVGEDGELPEAVVKANGVFQSVANMCRVLHSRGKPVIVESVVSRAKGSRFYIKGRDLHSTLWDTSCFKELVPEIKATFVFADQCEAGAQVQKTTQFMVTAPCAEQAMKHLGVLKCTHPPGSHEADIKGRNDDGSYVSERMGVYPEELCKRLALVFIDADGKQTDVAETDVKRDAYVHHIDMLEPLARVEIYWYQNREWYAATVLKVEDVRVGKGAQARVDKQVRVHYDADDKKMWHSVADIVVRPCTESSNATEEPMPTGTKMVAEGVKVTALPESDDDKLESAEADEPEAVLLMIGNEYNQSRDDVLLALVNQSRDLLSSLADDTLKELQPADDEFIVPEMWMSDVFVSINSDIESGERIRSGFVLALANREAAIDTGIDPINAHLWHEPKNEREYLRSPQKALWRTAKELKMEQYNELRLFELVPVSDVPGGAKSVLGTLWAHRIKLDENGKFRKLNPRWCVIGTGMDKDVYHSFADVARTSSFHIIFALRTLKYTVDFQIDQTNAFQSTRTDEPGSKSPPVYVWQAPGFEKRGAAGEKLCCKLLCGLQGRRDSGRLHAQKTIQLFLEGGFRVCTWDPKVLVLHNGPLAATDASLDQILAACHEKPATADAPLGWVVIGLHVDDGAGVASNWAMAEYTAGCLQKVYAVKLTNWKHVLGWKIDVVQLPNGQATVTKGAPAVLEQLKMQYLSDSIIISPKHVASPGIKKHSLGEKLDEADPGYVEYTRMQTETRSLLGCLIWLSDGYPQIRQSVNTLCAWMQSPSLGVARDAKRVLMHLIAYPAQVTWGPVNGDGYESLQLSSPLVPPYTAGIKEYGPHAFADAANEEKSVTGGAFMLAGGICASVCQRQHLTAPDSHAAEVVAAGTVLSIFIPMAGLLQELSIVLDDGLPIFIDSASTVFVANSNAAVKKSAWLLRRAIVMQETVELKDWYPIKTSDRNNLADLFTKYITYQVWARHVHYMLNLPGDPPDADPPPQALASG